MEKMKGKDNKRGKGKDYLNNTCECYTVNSFVLHLLLVISCLEICVESTSLRKITKKKKGFP